MNPIVKFLIDMIDTGLEKFGLFYSKYRAFVVDNEDPQGYNRVRLVIPGIADNPMDYWAWGVNQFAGPNYGSQMIPPKGTMVWVEFEKGDPNKPIWSHGSHSIKSQLPKELKDPNFFWFKTPGGNFIGLNDTTGEISITNKNGDSITSTNKGISFKSEKIYLGDKEKANETAALGDETAKMLLAQGELLGSAVKSISSLASSTTTFFTKVAASSTTGNSLAAAFSTGSVGLLKDLKDHADVTSKLNESISGMKDKIPGIKSNRVKIQK